MVADERSLQESAVRASRASPWWIPALVADGDRRGGGWRARCPDLKLIFAFSLYDEASACRHAGGWGQCLRICGLPPTRYRPLKPCRRVKLLFPRAFRRTSCPAVNLDKWKYDDGTISAPGTAA